MDLLKFFVHLKKNRGQKQTYKSMNGKPACPIVSSPESIRNSYRYSPPISRGYKLDSGLAKNCYFPHRTGGRNLL